MESMNVDKFNEFDSEIKGVIDDVNEVGIINEPKSKLRIYAIINVFQNIYFDKEEKMLKYIKYRKNFGGEKVIIDYFGHMAGRVDVIKVIYSDNSVKYFSLENDLGYVIYNQEKSISLGEDVWEYEYGELKDIYNEIKRRGIKLENDVYGRIDELYASVSDKFVEPLKRR